MENLETQDNSQKNTTSKKVSKNPKGNTLKKVDHDTAKVLFQLKEKINRKPYGRKITDAEIIASAVRLLGNDQIRELQEATYSEQDKLHMAHEDYQKAHGKLSLDQFIGRLLKGEIKLS